MATLNNEEFVAKLMRLLAKTQEEEFSCDETFALLDEYVELITNSEQAAALMPLVQAHLEMCPECGEEFKVLVRIIQGESSSASAAEEGDDRS